MKRFYYWLLPRYWWFMLYYKQWFRNNTNGIKGFAEQYLSHLLEETLLKSKILRQLNERLKDRKQRLEQEKITRQQLATIAADEYDTTRRKLTKERLYLFLILFGESYLTYILMQIFTGRTQNIIDGTLKFALAFIITAIIIVIVEELIRQFMLLFVHKDEKKKGSIPALVLFFLLTLAVEYMTYNFAQVRARDFEGGAGDGAAGMALTLLSMLLPFAGGWLAYSFAKDFGPYRNTKRLRSIEKELSKIEQQLKSNKEEEEHYFLMRCSDRYAVIHEMIIYKCNYDNKHGFPEENLQGHFCETREAFLNKAREEYQKRIQSPGLIPEVLGKASSNGVHPKALISNV